MLGFYQGMRISEIVGLRKGISRCCKADVVKLKQKDKPMIRKCAGCDSELDLKKDIIRSKTEWHIKPLTKDNIDYKQRLIRLTGKGMKDRNIPIMKPVMKRLIHLPIGGGERALELSFKKIAMEVLDNNMYFHCLRHSAATWLLNVKKWNLRQVQQFLGHANINTTQIYLHVSEQELVDLVWGEEK